MQIVRSWREQKILLKRRFPILDDFDFEFKEGEKEGMLLKLAAKLEKSRAELETVLIDLQRY